MGQHDAALRCRFTLRALTRRRRTGSPAAASPLPGTQRKTVSVTRVGWSLEQRAAVKRWMQVSTIFLIAGMVLSGFLIAKGNNGGWGLLVLCACMYGACFLYIRNIKRKQPG